jgi:hypothetical protein
MSTHARRLAARSLCALSLCALLAPARAHAWESVCRQYSDPTLAPAQYATMDAPACDPDSGPNVARNRWIGGLDEHRQLWERTARLAGLPASLSDTVQLRVFTGSATVAVGPSALPSLTPVAFAEAARAQTRAFTIGELAQLPDFSYALWDWAQGNETCPLDGAPAGMDAEQCHEFASHMGPVNANHFLPLAGEFFARGHALALERARECRAMRDALGPQAQRFGAYVNDCETEALALEAVAQHYLQDAWSMGHQWQRWGSPELTDFPGADPVEQHARAVLVALASGLIHGARGVLQKIPAWTGFDVDDALCAPSDDVRFVLGGEASHGLGDDYLAQLLPAQAGDAAPAAFAQQHDRLFA